MEIVAYALIAVAAVLGIITGAIYANHRIPAIVLFGITFLLTDVSICLFWAAKTDSVEKERDTMSGTLVPNRKPAKVLFSSESSSPTSLEVGDSGAIFTWAGRHGSPMLQIGEDPIIIEVLPGGDIGITTTIRGPGGQIVAEIVQNNWKLRPALLWDRNFNSSAVEVRDEFGDIVLQAQSLPEPDKVARTMAYQDRRIFYDGQVSSTWARSPS